MATAAKRPGPYTHPIVERMFAIDTRSLAAARIVLGLVLLLDLWQRSADLQSLYSDRGALPWGLVQSVYSEPWRWSLHAINGSPLCTGILMGVATVAACALVVGAATRVATIASWVLLVSLHHRLPVVNNAGDALLSLLLFWAMFLPWGEYGSVDACWRCRAQADTKGGRPMPRSILSAASGAILLQVAIMYAMSGYFKQRAVWQSGEALQWILAFDAYGKPAARYLVQFPQLLRVLTLGTLWLESIGPWLLFFPWYTAAIRIVVCSLLLLMHAGIACTMTVGLFSYVGLGALLLFVPAGVWDQMGRWLACRRPLASPTGHPASTHAGRSGVRPGLRCQVCTAVCLAVLGLIVLWNIKTILPAQSRVGNLFPPRLTAAMSALGLVQKWDMFSRPPRYDEWITATARLANGQQRDIWTGGAARDPFQPPDDPAAMYSNHRWRKLFRLLPRKRNEPLRAPIGRWLVDRWNRTHGPREQIVYFTLDFTQDRILRSGDPSRAVVTRLYSEGDAWQ